MKKLKIKSGAKILFTGDSITDSGRDKTELYGLTGYNRMVCAALCDVTGFNRGVNGETCRQILARLSDDCDSVQPDVISVLAGVNDTVPRGDPPYIETLDEFADTYDRLLAAASRYTDRIIVLEPFLIPLDNGMDKNKVMLIERIYAIRRAAHKYNCVYVPLNGIFAEHWIADSPEKYTVDCVHLTEDGKKLIADEWLKRTERI